MMASSAVTADTERVRETLRVGSLRFAVRTWLHLILMVLITALAVDGFAQDRPIGRATLPNRPLLQTISSVELRPIESEETDDRQPRVQPDASNRRPIRQENVPGLSGFVQASQRLIQTSAQPQPAESLPPTEPSRDAVDFDSKVENLAQAAEPWWHKEVQAATRDVPATVPVTLESLLLSALSSSSQVRVYKELPLIRETAIFEADAAFDSAAFVESRWDDTNDPVGNLLTTGGASRYKNNQWSGAAGLRKRTRVGGTLEVSERFGWQRTNSIYFQPPIQGTSKLAISYSQPLMRGRGKCYNESLVVLAGIDRSVSENEFSKQLQSHLMEVARAYWNLYLERSNLIQKQRAVIRATKILEQLSARANLDAVRSQIQRAEAEVATRESDLLRAEMAVENVEANIRTLVSDPALGSSESEVELLPMEMPSDERFAFDIQSALTIALEMRPEIEQAFRQVKAGMVRTDMSKNELLPIFTLITEAYVAGLQGDGSIGDAFTDQFRVGAPGYSIGIQFEAPLGNRAAQSRNDRRQYELRQLRNQYASTISTVSLEVEVAVREVETSYNEMLAQRRAMIASRAQYITLLRRWEVLPGEESTASLMLENLLIAQERLMHSEIAYTQAWTTYNLALINQRKATGELLQSYGISWAEYLKECQSCEVGAPLDPRLIEAAAAVKAQSPQGPKLGQKKQPARGTPAKVAAEYEKASNAFEPQAVQAQHEEPNIKPSSHQTDRKAAPVKRSIFARPAKPKPQ